jgi:hypothetical protein
VGDPAKTSIYRVLTWTFDEQHAADSQLPRHFHFFSTGVEMELAKRVATRLARQPVRWTVRVVEKLIVRPVVT